MLRYGGHRASSCQIRADCKRGLGTSLPTSARNYPLILPTKHEASQTDFVVLVLCRTTK